MYRFLILLLVLTGEARARDLDRLYKKESLLVGERNIQAYIADTEALRADGLMFITKIPEDTGMLFIFEGEQPLSFWMKNTMIPLAIAFLDSQGVVVDIQEMVPAESMVSLKVPTYSSRKPARFALEMNKGWFTKHKIKVGARLRARSKTLGHSLGLPTSGSPK